MSRAKTSRKKTESFAFALQEPTQISLIDRLEESGDSAFRLSHLHGLVLFFSGDKAEPGADDKGNQQREEHGGGCADGIGRM